MSIEKKLEELPLEAQFHIQKTVQMFPKMSREQLEQYARTVLISYLWSEQVYKQMIKTKWNIQ